MVSVKTGQALGTASAVVAVAGLMARDSEGVTILDTRADFTRRLNLISRRRYRARVRRAGGIVGWAAGLVVLLGLVVSAAAGLR